MTNSADPRNNERRWNSAPAPYHQWSDETIAWARKVVADAEREGR